MTPTEKDYQDRVLEVDKLYKEKLERIDFYFRMWKWGFIGGVCLFILFIISSFIIFCLKQL